EAGGSAEGGGGANPGNVGRKHYALSTDRVRAVGEAVAAVVATSEAVAVDAAGDVQVEWEPLPAVTDVFAGLAAGAPQLFEDALGLPQNQIRVVAPEVGGGFGVKFGLYPEDAVLAVIALVHRIPVRWTETRIEHMVATTHGRAQVADLEAAVLKDGTITAIRM